MTIFENDIFISYAHIDNATLIENQEGWITELHRVLEIRVAQLTGRKPKIWRDQKLTGNDNFSDALLQALPKVALLVSVVSPRYIQSEWCQRELIEFDRSTIAGAELGSATRVFKVVKTPVPLDKQPERLQQVLGYEFFVADPDTQRTHELNPWLGAEDQRQYFAKIDDLAHDITTLLECEMAGDTGASPTAEESRGVVYLAESSFDLRDDRETVKRDLIRSGFEVLPDRPLPLYSADLEESVAQDLEGARLSVHMIGCSFGIVPEGTQESIIQIQHRLATEAKLERLIWMQHGTTSDDERQLSFLDELQATATAEVEADLLQITVEDLKAAVHDKLAPPKRALTTPEVVEPTGTRQVYAICDQRDLEALELVEDFLFDSGLDVVTPAFEGDEEDLRLDHVENLCACDAVLFYWGAGDELWLRKQMRELRKAAGYGRERPMLASAVLIAPPHDRKKLRLRSREADIYITEPDGFTPAGLEPFVKLLNGSLS